MIKIIDISPTPGVDPLKDRGILQGFPTYATIVRGLVCHADLTRYFIDYKNRELEAAGQPGLTTEQEKELMYNSVRMFAQDGEVRIVVEDLESCLDIDRQLQELLPKENIRFLDNARQLLRAGLCWRCSAPVKTMEDKIAFIQRTRTPLCFGLEVFHAPFKGTRYILADEVGKIRNSIGNRLLFLNQISELYELLHKRNRRGLPELCFFMGKPRKKFSFLMVLASEFDRSRPTWETGERERAGKLFDQFYGALKNEIKEIYQSVSYDIPSWVNHMYELLSSNISGPPTWEKAMSSEFWHSISWMPGASMVDGEPVFESDPAVNDIVKGLIEAYAQRFYSIPLEYINIGVLRKSLRTAVPFESEIDRWVGVVILKYQGQDQRIYLVRKEKWGVMGRLMRGETDDIQIAQEKAREYSEYIALRLFGLRMLNYNVPDFERIDCQFHLEMADQPEILIEESFWQRPYIEGVATDKLSDKCFATPGFSRRLAGMMGYLAGKNIIIGRADGLGQVRFDDGDEVVILDEDELPERVIEADLPGSFFDYERPLTAQIPEYRDVLINMITKSRAGGIRESEIEQVKENYAAGFQRGFSEIRTHYLNNRPQLDGLFVKYRHVHGHFHCRWHAILKRLANTELDHLIPLLLHFR